eukprot:CAMPEP_0116891126 /NCGR_PEP_ID=MMETSP0467-20121206/1592_1 /TAXON_ID=283647 /ORGANISM="Mesodinium pulex, Strain SPMC105" /LENGTH=88 /DNA_ID=CAMNT_0004559429 /DNA_START=229 /DNA_END=492 /DNA_ORIENTATION=+
MSYINQFSAKMIHELKSTDNGKINPDFSISIDLDHLDEEDGEYNISVFTKFLLLTIYFLCESSTQGYAILTNKDTPNDYISFYTDIKD